MQPDINDDDERPALFLTSLGTHGPVAERWRETALNHLARFQICAAVMAEMIRNAPDDDAGLNRQYEELAEHDGRFAAAVRQFRSARHCLGEG